MVTFWGDCDVTGGFGSPGSLPYKHSQYFLTTKLEIDDYAKSGGPGEVRLLCSFYHESLRTGIKTIVNKFAI